MSRTVSKTSSVILIPTSFDNTVGSYHFQTGSRNAGNITSTNYSELNNAFTNSNSSSYARLYLSSNGNSTRTSQAYFDFDKSLLDEIPSNAAITSISCNVRYTLSNLTYITAVSMQLYSGTTPKGSAKTDIEDYLEGGRLYTITSGTWTRNELQNIRFYISATHNKSNSGAYIYFFGADVTIKYSYQATEYEITTTVQSGSTTFSPTSQYVESGLDGVVTINNLSDISTFSLTDNGDNVVSYLVYVSENTYTYTIENISADHALIAKTVPAYNVTIQNNSSNISSTTPSGTTNADQGSNLQININTNYWKRILVYDNNTLIPNGIIHEDEITGSFSKQLIRFIDRSNFTPSTSYSLTNAYNNVDNTSSSARIPISGNNTYVIWGYEDISSLIPDDAEITVTCRVKAYISNTSSSITNKTVQLYSGTTAKGSSTTIPTSNTITTIANPGTWTKEELSDIRIRFGASYTGNSSYYIYVYGTELTISYVIGEKTYYIVENIQSARTIKFEDKTQYNITSSSELSGISLSPSSTQVYEGNDVALEIIGVTSLNAFKLLDNNANVTSSIIRPVLNTYEVTTQVSGAEYGFALNGSGYYESTNQGIDNSASVCRVNFNFESAAEVTIQYINYGEARYDYGIFSNIDSSLNTTSTADSNTFKSCNTNEDNTLTPQTLIYQIPAGSHFIDIKFRKDSGTNTSPDSLQWKILNISGGSNSYTYTITNVIGNHTLIIKENTYYSVSGTSTFSGKTISGTSNKVYQGDSITLTLTGITNPYSFTLKDNGVDVTSQVNISDWKYSLINVVQDHTLRLEEATKYTINASSTFTGVTVNPTSAEVYQGEDINITLIGVTNIFSIIVEDNDIDVTSQVSLPSNEYIVTNQVSGAAYGFTLNGNNYYESTNKNQNSRSALCRVNFNFSTSCDVTIEYINYAEATYDYGIFGNIDTALSTNNTADTNAFKRCNNESDNLSTVQTLVYSIPAGSHFIDIKYYKDNYTNLYNDTLQWKIKSIQPTGTINYIYTISNVTIGHTVVVSEASYKTITSSSTFSGVDIYPSGSNKIYQNGYIDFSIVASTTQWPGVKLLLDDITDITNSISSDTHIYRFYDDGNNHTIKVTELPKYTVTGTGYNGITVSISLSPVYVGNESTITINNVSDINEITIFDNSKAITGRFNLVGSSYVYTLTNINTNHTITIGAHVTYNITSTNDTNPQISIIPTGTRIADAGEVFTIALLTNNVSKVKVVDNTVNTSNRLVYVAAQNNQRAESYPYAVDIAPDGFNSGNPADNAFDPSSDTSDHARLTVPLSETIYAVFNLTPIELPEYAIINSVSCTIRAAAYSTEITPRTVRLYSGTTAKGNAVTLPSNNSSYSTATINNANAGSWTLNELKDIKLRFDATNTVDTSRYIRFYGATFTVIYTIPEHYEYNIEDVSAAHTVVFSNKAPLKIRDGNTWKEAVNMWVRINDTWVQKDEISEVFDTSSGGKIYISKKV